MSQSGMQAGGELVYAVAIGAGLAVWRYGRRLDQKFTRYVDHEQRRQREDLRSYRMVRYLPRWISLSVPVSSDSSALSCVRLDRGVSLLHHF